MLNIKLQLQSAENYMGHFIGSFQKVKPTDMKSDVEGVE